MRGKNAAGGQQYQPRTLLAKIARPVVGLLKAFGAKPNPNFLAGMDRFSDTFIGPDPWLTGGLPRTPKDAPGTPPRKWQYQPGSNLNFTVRSGEALTFDQLRDLGDYTLVRLFIERAKDAMKAHEWDISCKEEEADRLVEGDAHDEDIKTLKKFFSKPDRRNGWAEWLGQLLEETMVTDALSIYPHMTRGGDPWAYEIIDGDTIKVLVDYRGFEPMPPAPAFQQFLYGVPKGAYTSDELFYRPRNRRAKHFYGFSPVEQIAVIINMGFRRELTQLAVFTDGTIPAAFLQMPPDWTAEEIRSYQEYWDAILAGDPQNQSRLRMVPGGGGGVIKFHDGERYEVQNKFDEWLARVCAYSFGLSPTALMEMHTRATADKLGDEENEKGIESLKLWVKRLMDELIQERMGFEDLEFIWTTDQGQMSKKRVDRNKVYVADSIVTIDEARLDEGKKPLGLRPGIITPQGYMPFSQEDFLPDSPFIKDALSKVDLAGEMANAQQPPVSSVGNKPDSGNKDDTKAQKALESAIEFEMKQWEKKALSTLGKYGYANVRWEPDYIGRKEASAITSALAKAKLPDEVKRIFSKPAGERSVRLNPPAARDAAHHVSDLQQKMRDLLVNAALDAVKGNVKR